MPERKELVVPVEATILIAPEPIEAVEMRDIEQPAPIIIAIVIEHKTIAAHITQRIGPPEEQLPELIANRQRDLHALIPDRRDLPEQVLLSVVHQEVFLRDILLQVLVLHPVEVVAVAEDNLTRTQNYKAF